jgi:hypothetical protein
MLLGVLTSVDRNSNTSQRTISRELDVALGLANADLKRCLRKGLIKIKQVPRRRYAYHLTPKCLAKRVARAHNFTRLTRRVCWPAFCRPVVGFRWAAPMNSRYAPKSGYFDLSETSKIMLINLFDGQYRYLHRARPEATENGRRLPSPDLPIIKRMQQKHDVAAMIVTLPIGAADARPRA